MSFSCKSELMIVLDYITLKKLIKGACLFKAFNLRSFTLINHLILQSTYVQGCWGV